MSFCIKCGNKLADGVFFCDQCGTPVQKPAAAPSGNVTSSQPTAQAHTIYESFSPKWGIGGKPFVLTDDSLIYGNEKIPYAQMNTISLLTAPTPITNGIAQTTANGKVLTLAYDFKQKDRFATALNYANRQIDEVHDVKKYRYQFQANTGTKIEVYDEYLILYYVAPSPTKIIGNIIGGGNSGKIIAFSDIISITYLEPKKGNPGSIRIFYHGATEGTIPVLPADKERVREMVDYINAAQQVRPEELEEQSLDAPWEPVKGSVQTFPLLKESLEISENLDAFNTYRLRFREMASTYADKAQREYQEKVHNLETFLTFFPKLYNSNLEVLIQKAVDICILENIWTVTKESLLQQHTNEMHKGLDDYYAVLESMDAIVANNKCNTAGVMSFVPNLFGGGFGLKGALKGIAAATAFNTVRDGIESSAIKNANINQGQRTELFNHIQPNVLFQNVFSDYYNVSVTLTLILNQNGHNLWLPTAQTTQRATNIFQNLSNPNFPQDKVVIAMLELIKVNPYRKDYYQFMIDRFGATDEIVAIKDYFGFTDFNDPRAY